MIVFVDEAYFRQTPTLHATWARVGQQPQIPSRGQRHTQRVFGAVSVPGGRLAWRHQEASFQWPTYLGFVDEVLLPTFYRRGHRVYLIQDNASYHKNAQTWTYFAAHRRYVEVFLLPPYCPELNAQEPIWRYTRRQATHNRFFEQPQQLCQALFATFRRVQRHPELIQGLLRPFW